MTTTHLVPQDIRARFEVHEWRNTADVLHAACSKEWKDIVAVLRGFRLLRSEVAAKGGNKSPISRRIDGAFFDCGWTEKKFQTSVLVDDAEYKSPTHKVDCFHGRVALEVEWNNKNPFYDRDLNNFRLLFDLRAIDVGVIVTRSDELQTLFDEIGKGKSYANNTTHMAQLLPRIEGGGGGGCPILVFGISRRAYVDDR